MVWLWRLLFGFSVAALAITIWGYVDIVDSLQQSLTGFAGKRTVLQAAIALRFKMVTAEFLALGVAFGALAYISLRKSKQQRDFDSP